VCSSVVIQEQQLLKELAKLKTGNQIPPSAVTAGVTESLLPSGLHQMVSTGVDPFLGQSAVVSSSVRDAHGRPSNADGR
jgi:hypothetical protein